MKLPIEHWIESGRYSHDVEVLFNEAVTCYKGGAYRASLLYSYLGFETIVKDIILQSKTPDGLNDNEWSAQKRDVKNPDKWEDTVFNLMNRVDRPAFHLSPDLRHQLQYWRARRNDCAHYKDNEIGEHHTVSFWSFIKSNLPKIAVNGGKAGLLSKFEEHFDDTKTDPDEDFNHLIGEIGNSVSREELPDFYAGLYTIVQNRRWAYTRGGIVSVFAQILSATAGTVQEEAANLIKNSHIDLELLTEFPNLVPLLRYTKPEVREIWKVKVFRGGVVNPFTVCCGLLRAGLVPQKEISELNAQLFDKYNQQDWSKAPNDNDVETLKANGFFELVFQKAIVEANLDPYYWVNSKAELVVLLVEHTPLNVETVRAICEMASRVKHSQWLLRDLGERFRTTKTCVTISAKWRRPMV